jgi:hypothetical protein
MDFIKLVLSAAGHYQYKEASNIPMNILGNFLASDVGCSSRLSMRPTLQEWALDDSYGIGFCGNITSVDKVKNEIILSDLFADEDDSMPIIMTRQQFVYLLNDWQEKVCKGTPKIVTIKHVDGQFFIETQN